MAEQERLLSPTRRNVRGRHWAQRPRDAWPRAAYRLVSRAVPVQPALPLRELLALQHAHADESGLPQAYSFRVLAGLRPAAVLRVHELEPCASVGQRLRALPVRLALPPSRWEPQAHSVSQRLAARSLAAVLQARRVSTARPSLLLPSLLFPPEQSLPLALLLRRRPESSCAPFQRRPRGSSSSASSFP